MAKVSYNSMTGKGQKTIEVFTHQEVDGVVDDDFATRHPDLLEKARRMSKEKTKEREIKTKEREMEEEKNGEAKEKNGEAKDIQCG